MNKRNNSARLLAALTIMACVALAALMALIIRRAELNQDEGWYLYGAGLIHQGLRPYIDFATTQGPVMQYVYSFFWGVIAKWGVQGGRILTAVFGALAIGLAVAAAARAVAPKKRGLASFAVLCLAGLNVYQLFFFSTVKTYALAAVWIGASFLLLTFNGKRRNICAFFAGVLMMLAAATRMSAGAMLPAVVLCLLLEARTDGSLKKDLRWLAYGVGAALCMAAVFGPFLVKAPQGIKFAMFEYHAGRSSGSALETLAYKGGFIARVVRAYYPAILGLIGIAAYQLFSKKSGEVTEHRAREKRFSGMILASVLLVTLLHFAAPFPYDDYQAMVFPLFCAGVVVAGSGMLPSEKQGRTAMLLLLAGLLFAGASPINEKMFIGKRDRIWWPMRTETSLQKLDRAVDLITARAGESKELLTQDLYIAVESGMRVPTGLALGPFSYFPDWPREKAERLHVVNDEMLKEILASSEANTAAISGYGLAIRAPEISPYEKRDELLAVLHEHFEPVDNIADFGQAETELIILERKLK